mmetsp:Transcript_5247/g.7279  ORF Transcript_5247/g.7279 Transcript_5247/m.7279 type:complete len:88 (-) Transcript_5247:17-280(-)
MNSAVQFPLHNGKCHLRQDGVNTRAGARNIMPKNVCEDTCIAGNGNPFLPKTVWCAEFSDASMVMYKRPNVPSAMTSEVLQKSEVMT